jgi:hypothetical protein
MNKPPTFPLKTSSGSQKGEDPEEYNRCIMAGAYGFLHLMEFIVRVDLLCICWIAGSFTKSSETGWIEV